MNTTYTLLLVRIAAIVADHLAAQALEEYLAVQEWQIQAIHAGLDEIRQGAVVDFADIKQL